MFGLTEIVLVLGAVLFSLLASAEVQPWAKEGGGTEAEGEGAEAEGVKRKRRGRTETEEEESGGTEAEGSGRAEQPLLETKTNALS